MDLGHNGKTVIISGGSKGIGAGISEVFAQEGANIVINYHSNQCVCQELADYLIEKYKVKVACVGGDVGRESDVSSIFDCAIEHFGQVDILVNNAGRGVSKEFTDITLEEWNQCLNDNLTGQFLMSREFARRVIPTKRKGWIVNILSKASYTSTTKGRVCYVCNKAGEVGLTHSLAVDLTGHNIHVNGVMPGFVMANTLKTQYESNRGEFDRRVNRVPLKRVGEPWEIGTMVAFLASDKCQLAVGTCVDMTGGLLLGY